MQPSPYSLSEIFLSCFGQCKNAQYHHKLWSKLPSAADNRKTVCTMSLLNICSWKEWAGTVSTYFFMLAVYCDCLTVCNWLWIAFNNKMRSINGLDTAHNCLLKWTDSSKTVNIWDWKHICFRCLIHRDESLERGVEEEWREEKRRVEEKGEEPPRDGSMWSTGRCIILDFVSKLSSNLRIWNNLFIVYFNYR